MNSAQVFVALLPHCEADTLGILYNKVIRWFRHFLSSCTQCSSIHNRTHVWAFCPNSGRRGGSLFTRALCWLHNESSHLYLWLHEIIIYLFRIEQCIVIDTNLSADLIDGTGLTKSQTFTLSIVSKSMGQKVHKTTQSFTYGIAHPYCWLATLNKNIVYPEHF